ncbi:MAG TPA: glycosyltransferase [Bacteroidia bacterium]|nr:glycosyltransferase [Bacteroidia bacterium]HRG51199.1 glycosyltransferase [Bacteroidia bacterium]
MIQQKKEHIAFVINSLKVGGTEKIVVESCNNLDFTKYDVTIVCLSEHDASNSILDVTPLAKNINVVYFSYYFNADYSLLGYFKLFFNTSSHSTLKPVVDYLNTLKPQIVHFHTSPRELMIGTFLKYKVKKIFTDHTLRILPDQYGKIKTWLLILFFKRLYKHYDIITVSHQIKQNLIDLAIIHPKRKIIVVQNSIDTTFFDNPSPFVVEQLAVIYVSRIAEWKGHKDLIMAWSLLKAIPNKKLMIVGPDSLQGEMQRYASELNCSDSIEFTGTVSNSKEWLLKANIAVFPSYKEGLPLSLLEKMSMQLPVIVYDIEELASIIKDNQTGILCKTGDFHALAEKISQLYKNTELRKELGRNARSYVIQYHQAKNNQKEIEKFYDHTQPT